MPPHLFIAPEQALEIEVHDPDSNAKALVVGTVRSIPRFAGCQAYRIVVVGKARPLAKEDELPQYPGSEVANAPDPASG